jgi:hypothetical protein
MEVAEVRLILEEKAKWYLHTFGLGSYTVKLNFTNTTREDSHGFITYASTDADWRYLRCTINFYPNVMTELTERELEDIVVHEIQHVFLNEMRDSGIEHEERTASSLQRAFANLELAVRRECKEEFDELLAKNNLKIDEKGDIVTNE